MIKQYQVTIFHKNNKYKPISTIVSRHQENNDNLLLNKTQREAIKIEGIKKICMKKYWGTSDLKAYEYTKVKLREYPQE